MRALLKRLTALKSDDMIVLGNYALFSHLVDGAWLFAPASYWLQKGQTGEVRGCGPGKWGDYLVPDTMYLLNVKESCAIHDEMYRIGQTPEDKIIADRTMLLNTLSIISAKSWPVIRELRCYRAMTYYLAVMDGGASVFGKKRKGD